MFYYFKISISIDIFNFIQATRFIISNDISEKLIIVQVILTKMFLMKKKTTSSFSFFF